jgi:Uma2 family endonuclease
MPEMPDTPFFTLAPDWVAEILSPSTTAHDRIDKASIYARERVEYLWLIEPAAQTLEALVLKNEQWLRVGAWKGDAAVRAEPFDAIQLELGALWAR